MLIVAVSLSLIGCVTPVANVLPFYEPVRLPEDAADVLRDLPYRSDDGAHPEKHRLDVYRPDGEGWPTLIFVHGGSLEGGDKNKRLVGLDIYGNIGRFYSARGVGVVVVNYRLQPEVGWREQVDDVAAATAWTLDHVRDLGGDGRVFLSGHSAGAWLSARVALDVEVQEAHGFDGSELDGVISISGSGFEMTDEQTWEMFPRERRWARRFAVDEPGVDWKVAASVIPLLEDDELSSAPPFLLLYSTREWKALARQNRLLRDALNHEGIPVTLIGVDSGGHRRNVLALSHRERELPRYVLSFVQEGPSFQAPYTTESGFGDRQ
jgi:acetyl esterase/lipase